MPIRKYLVDKPAFSLETIAAMSKAFEGACIALRVYAGDEKGREIIKGLCLLLTCYCKRALKICFRWQGPPSAGCRASPEGYAQRREK